MLRVTHHVRRGGGVPGGTCGQSGGLDISAPGCGMRGKGGLTRLPDAYLATRPGAGCRDGLARTRVIRLRRLEQRRIADNQSDNG